MAAPLIIRNTQAPGDIAVLSAAIRDLCIAHPGRYDIKLSVSSGAEQLYYNNPYINKIVKSPPKGEKGQQFVAHYPAIKRSNQDKKHFLWGFIEHMNSKLMTNVKLTEFKPDIHMSDEEMATPIIKPPYWLFLSGGKTDFITKIWSRQYWEKVIAATRKDIRWVQCGGGSKNHVMHEKITGVHDYLVKNTSLRDFIRLIYHAEGVICAVTAAMHIAAGLNKPCIVIAGGREPWWWEAYNLENRLVNMRLSNQRWQPPTNDTFVPHKFLHTIGQLPCCQSHGCWKSKLSGGASLCKSIVTIDEQHLPKCQAMITPEMVISAIYEYKGSPAVAIQRVIEPIDLPVDNYYIFGEDQDWLAELSQYIPIERIIHMPINVSRHIAVKQAIERCKMDKKAWLFWLEPGSMPTAPNWLKIVKDSITNSKVYGKLYRTSQGTLYPHHGFFAANIACMADDAESYIGLFSKLKDADFMAMGSEVKIRMTRPCQE